MPENVTRFQAVQNLRIPRFQALFPASGRLMRSRRAPLTFSVSGSSASPALDEVDKDTPDALRLDEADQGPPATWPANMVNHVDAVAVERWQ